MSEVKKIKVILADDHKIVLEGLKLLLENDDEIKVVGIASNGQQLLDLLQHTPADLVLLDIHMPIMDGYEAAKLIKEMYPKIRILALSMLVKEQHVKKMIEAGASGYILKDSNKLELKAAIKLVASGNQFMCAELFSKLLQKADTEEPFSKTDSSNGVLLSSRELEILNLIAEGFTNLEIADKLFVSKRTVETHRLNILEKTKSKNTPHLIKYSIQQGYLSI